MSSDPLAESLTQITQKFAARFEATMQAAYDEQELVIKPEQIVPVCLALRDEENFEMMVDQTAVDFFPNECPRFHVVYKLRSIARNLIIGLIVPLDGNEPFMPSLVSVFPNADYYERELWDLFGIRFAGHPDLRRILMPHDWEGHPLRKDYPLGYEEPQFTFNFEKIQARKLSPKE